MLRILAERRLRATCPHPEHRVFLAVRRRLFRRHSWERFCDECAQFLEAETCSRDEDCAEH